MPRPQYPLLDVEANAKKFWIYKRTVTPKWEAEPMKFRNGYPRASLIAQLVKNAPAMQETPIRSLGREDPLEKQKATHFSALT